jgi:hypothetical protein
VPWFFLGPAFLLRSNATMRFKEWWLHSSSLTSI